MITILHNLEKQIDKPDIPAEIWSEWKSSLVTQHLYQIMKGMQIDELDKLMESDICVRSCRAKIDLLETIINYKPESVDV